jgi:hypothetical protein
MRRPLRYWWRSYVESASVLFACPEPSNERSALGEHGASQVPALAAAWPELTRRSM